MAVRLPKFENSRLIAEHQKCNRRALRMSPAPEAEALADKLEQCGKTPCWSGACPYCYSKYQRRFCQQVADNVLPDSDFLMLTAFPKALVRNVSGDGFFDPVRDKNALTRGLQRALGGDAIFVGGIDISLNVLDNGPATWAPHLHGFVVLPGETGVDRRRYRDHLRETIAQHNPLADEAGGQPVYRPITLTERTYHEFRRNLSYVCKDECYRRSQYTVTRKWICPQTGQGHFHASTRVKAQTLRGPRRAELLQFLDQHPIGMRLLLIGLQRRGHPATFTITRSSPPVVTNSVREKRRSAERLP